MFNPFSILTGSLGALINSQVPNRIPFNDVESEVTIGVVVDVLPYADGYFVQTPIATKLQCVNLSDIVAVTGARSFSTIPVGTSVFVVKPFNMKLGFIVGVIPLNASYKEPLKPDSIVIADRIGAMEDVPYNMFYSAGPNAKKNSGGVFGFSAGRPVDVLPGDWGYINQYGAGLGLGALMSWLKASDLAKIECSVLDHYVRLMAYNYELSTAGSEDRCLEDEGEYSRIKYLTPFSWEAVGASLPDTTADDSVRDGVGSIQRGHEYAPSEPIKDDQTSLWRYLRLEGYLGDLLREYVVLPPTSAPEYLSRSLDERDYRGLLEIRSSLDGNYSIKSAKGISFEKTFLIPVPIQIKRAEDPEGDSAENYDGAQWKWADSEVDGDAPLRNHINLITTTPLLRAVLDDEVQSYVNNWFYQESIKRHVKDWYVPSEESVYDKWLEADDLTAFSLPDTKTALQDRFSYDAPEFIELDIDHRTKSEYYLNSSKFKLLNDGGILFEDGYGSQILMSGGNIHLTCPGSIFMNPGKSVVTMAGEDVIAVANKNIELSTSSEDVRIKAQRNLHMVAGIPATKDSFGVINQDSGVGGILLETKSKSTGSWSAGHGEGIISEGIILKSATTLSAKSETAMMFEASGTTSTVSISANNAVYIVGGSIINQIAQGKYLSMSFENQVQNKIVTNRFSTYRTTLGSSLDVDGNLIVSKGAFIDRSILADSIIIEDYIRAKGFTESESGSNGALSAATNSIDARISVYADEYLEDRANYALHGLSYGIITQGFSFRTSTEYGTDNDYSPFVAIQPKWQRILENNENGTVWSEPVVLAPDGTETMPFPGI